MRRLIVFCLALAFLGIASTAGARPAATLGWIDLGDGVSLAACFDIDPALGRAPTILRFGPYGVNASSAESPASPCADATIPLSPGSEFNYVAVSVRGTGGSSGAWSFFGEQDREDLYHVVQWIVDQNWSDGDVALSGFSANAIYATASLRRMHPAVRAIVARSPIFDVYRDALYQGGIYNEGGGALEASLTLPGWANGAQRNAARGVPPDPTQPAIIQHRSLVEPHLHPTTDAYHDERSIDGGPFARTVPVLMNGGWYDFLAWRGVPELFMALRGSGSHATFYGGHEGVPWQDSVLGPMVRDWLRHHLLGEPVAWIDGPPVHMFVPAGGQEAYNAKEGSFMDAADWPLPGTEFSRMYLDASGLSSIPPGATQAGDTYTFASHPPPAEAQVAASRGVRYASTPLTAPVTIAGPISLKVWLSSTAGTTDIVARLLDVAPDGTEHLVSRCRLRTSFRGLVDGRSLLAANGDLTRPFHKHDMENEVERGAVADYWVECRPSANTFGTQHRIVLVVDGTNEILFDGAPEPARNTVWHEPGRESFLVLPVLPQPAE